MLKSARKSLIVSFEKIAVFTLVLSLPGAGAAFAAAGGNPGPPHPIPPCISTGLLSESNSNGGCYACNVRNVGGTSHNVTIDFRDTQNLTDSRTRNPITLAPGQSVIVTFCSSTPDVLIQDACVVTTEEGTTGALEDLTVLMQFDDASSHAGAESKIFDSCAPSSGLAPGSPS
jgi:hypothetical protein